jgi:hypothetical protein
MKRARLATGLLAACVCLAVAAQAQAQAQEMPPMPKPGPEHELFKSEAGMWDATIEMTTPGGPMTSKGMETNTVGCGGLCLISDFKGEMMPGTMFEGHGVSAYDANKKKYVGTWTDSMSVGIALTESIWDPATKTMTGWIEGFDAMAGKTTKTKAVSEHKDANTRVFTMYGPDGAVGMKITYTRKQ